MQLFSPIPSNIASLETGGPLYSIINSLSGYTDSSFVRRTGVSFISGSKTFTDKTIIGSTGNSLYTYPLAGPIFGTNSIQQPQLLVMKNSGSSGIQVALYATNYANLASSETTFSVIGNTIDFGTGYAPGDHAVGVIGIGQNTPSGNRPLIGVEGRVFAQGDASKAHIGVLGIADFIGPTITGSMVGVESRVTITQSGQGSTPVYSGAAYSFKANKIEGGNPSESFSFIGFNTIRNYGPIQCYNTGGTVEGSISIDDSDVNIRSNNINGSIRMGPGANGYLLLDNGAGLVGLPGGKSLGIDPFRWLLFATSGNFNAGIEVLGGVRFSSFGAGTLSSDSAGNISATSDERLKNIQGSFTKGVDYITGLNPIIYKWNAESRNEENNFYVGLGAQQVRQYIPEAIGTGLDGYLTIQDRPIIAALINAIKELKTEIEILKN
jgi:hypothetical protein